MKNVQKYFLILESLNYGANCQEADNNVKNNVDILKKYLKSEDISSDSTLKGLHTQISENSPESCRCSYYLLHVILTIKNNINLDSISKEDLISVRHLSEYFNAIKLASRYAIVHNLPGYLQAQLIFKSTVEMHCNSANLRNSLLIIAELFSVTTISSNRAIDSVVLELMAGIYSGLMTPDPELEEILILLWNRTPKENYFRYLLILKSIKALPTEIQVKLHGDLLSKLIEPGGFKLLLLNTVPSIGDSIGVPNWRRYEVVAQIVAHKGHTDAFYTAMIEQIFQFVQNSSFDLMEKSMVPAGIVTLRKMCLLNRKLRQNIEDRLDQMFKPFVEPVDVLSGLIVMDADEFEKFLIFQSACFNGSLFETLPTVFLVKYLPLLIGIYGQIEGNVESKDLITLICQCLSNMKTDELRIILKSVFNKNDNLFPMKYLHNRILVRRNEVVGKYSFQIAPEDLENAIDLASNLVSILKNSNNNILVYSSFVQILMILEEVDSINNQETDVDLLQNVDELDVFLAEKFRTRISVISSLTELVAFHPFHTQFKENPSEILEFLQSALTRRINNKSSSSDTDSNLPVLLAVFQEFIESAKDYHKYRAVSACLKTYLKYVYNEDLCNQIRSIVSFIDDGPRISNPGALEYNLARSLLSESKSHLRVYGITQLIKLLNARDDETLCNRHSILAMALHALRDEESYTYLNCIRLFMCLMNSMHSEVLETLSAEYLNDNETIDFRLKIGEAMVKVTEELGSLSYNYKDILINCFLYSCLHKIDEFRASSMSNLSTVCRLLSYQVHNFFQEMMLMIESTLQTDTYLPARRASVLILSQLLWGVENLKDFEENLLPIYRLLRTVVANDNDEKTRIHATNGLAYLKDKCKSFLFPEQKIEKEIKIFGIKDDVREKNIRGHML